MMKDSNNHYSKIECNYRKCIKLNFIENNTKVIPTVSIRRHEITNLSMLQKNQPFIAKKKKMIKND
jgi:hypothetical protein